MGHRVAAASRKLRKPCLVSFDLAGPKLRIGVVLGRKARLVLDLDLLRLAVGEGNQEKFEEALNVFRGYYLEHCLDRTTFYPGIEPMLEHFAHKQKVIATNKSIEYTRVILNGLGPQHFMYMVGGDNGFGLKPEPGMLLHIISKMGVPKDRTVLVGDSTNDINGGHNAGIRVCAVGYGMGNRQKMEACQPDWFIEKPEQLMEIFI